MDKIMSKLSLLQTSLTHPNSSSAITAPTALNANIPAPVAAPLAPVAPVAANPLITEDPLIGVGDFNLKKSFTVEQAAQTKLNNIAETTNLKRIMLGTASDGTDFNLSEVQGKERDSAAGMSVDQAQKMIGAGARTVGSFMDNQDVETWGQSVIDQQEIDLEEGAYRSDSTGGSVRDMFNDQGAGVALSRIWEMMQENLATSGVALAGGLAASITAPFSAPAALFISGATLTTSFAMGVGETALEMEDKGVEINDASAIGTGVLISILDRFGASKVIPKNLLSRMTGDQIIKRLVEKGYKDAAKGVAKKILGASLWESGTEVVQEALIMDTAAQEGATYDKKEVVDRFIDVAFVAAGMGGTTATVAGTAEVVKGATLKAAGAFDTGLETLKQQAELAAVIIEDVESEEGTSTDGVNLPQAEKAPDSPRIKFIKFIRDSKFHQLSSEERTAEITEEYLDEFNALAVAASEQTKQDENAGLTPNKAETDYLDMALKKNDAVANLYNQLTEVDKVDQLEATKLVAAELSKFTSENITEADKAKLKNDILLSTPLINVASKDALTAAEMTEAKEKLGIKDGESKEIDDYIALRLSIEEVSTQVIEGTDEDGRYKGLNTYFSEITKTLASKTPAKALAKLADLKGWADYHSFKVKTFKAIGVYNAGIADPNISNDSLVLPEGVDLVESKNKDGTVRNDAGKINRFTINYANFGFDKFTDSKKEWFYNTYKPSSPKSTAALVEQMANDETNIIAAYNKMADIVATATNETVETITKATNVQPVDTVTAPTVDPIVTENNAGTTNVNEVKVEVKSTPSTNEVVDTSVDNLVADTAEVVVEETKNVEESAKKLPGVQDTTKEQDAIQIAENAKAPAVKETAPVKQKVVTETVTEPKIATPVVAEKVDQEPIVALVESRLNEEQQVIADEINEGLSKIATRLANLYLRAIEQTNKKNDKALTNINKEITQLKNYQTKLEKKIPKVALNPALVHNTKDDLFPSKIEDVVVDQTAVNRMFGKAGQVANGVIVSLGLDPTTWLGDIFSSKKMAKVETLASVLENVEVTKETQVTEDAVIVEETETVVTEESLTGKSYLNNIKNFFVNYKKILGNLALDTKQTQLLAVIAQMNDRLTKSMPKTIESLSDPSNVYSPNERFPVNGTLKVVLQFPMLLLAKGMKINKRGYVRSYFDPNVINIINMAGINWVATQGKGTLYNTPDDINRIASNEGTARTIEENTLEKLRNAGGLYTSIVDSIGRDIYRQLGLQLNDDSLSIYEARMISSLGMAAVQNMIADGILIKSFISASDIYTYQGTDQATDPQIAFIQVATVKDAVNSDGFKVPTPQVERFLKLTSPKFSTAYTNLLKKISGTELRSKYPGTKPKIVSKVAKYLKSDRPLPKKVRASLERANRTKWQFKPEMLYLLDPTKTSREDATEFFKQLQGFMYDIDNRPLYLQAGDRGRNLGIMNEIEGVFEFYDQHVESGAANPFYFSYNTGENGRHTVNETGFSYQASKLVRHLIYSDNYSEKSNDGFRVDVELNGNKGNLQYFKYAVVQALSKNVKIDHGKHDEIVAEFARLIKDIDYKEAALSVYFNGYTQEVSDFLASRGLKAHGLDGLQALGSYLNAVSNNDASFKTDLAIETDAITSGVMLTMMNFGALDKSSLIRLSTGGIFLRDEKTGKYNLTIPEYRKDSLNNEDVYTMLLKPWQLRVKNYLASNKKYSPVENLVKLDRDATKPIIMQGSYMAQYATLIKSFMYDSATGQLRVLHERLYKAQVEDNVLERREIFSNLIKLSNPRISSTDLELQINNYITNLDLSKDPLPAKLLNSYETALEQVYGTTLETELASDTGMRPHANSMNKMVNIMSWYYRWEMKKAIDAIGGQDALTPAKLKEIYANPALKALTPYLPTPDSLLAEEGLAALGGGRTRLPESDTNKVKITMQRKSASMRAATETTENQGARSFVVSVQSLDDAIIRGVMEAYSVMSAFDAVYASIGVSVGASRLYNKKVLERSKEFSIFGETYSNFSKVMDTLDSESVKDSGHTIEFLKFISQDTDSFNKKDYFVKQYLSGFELLDLNNNLDRAKARELFKEMRKNLGTENDVIENQREEFFSRIVSVDHMGMPNTNYLVEANLNAETALSLDGVTPVQLQLPGVEENTAEKPKKLKRNYKEPKETDGLMSLMAKMGGIDKKSAEESGFQDEELNTKSSEFPFYGLFPSKGGRTLDGMLQDIGIEQLQSLGIEGDIDLNGFVDLIKNVINSGDVVENDYYSDEGKQILEQERVQEEENMDKLLADQNLQDTQENLLNNDPLGSMVPGNENDIGMQPAGALRADTIENVFDTINGTSNTGNQPNSPEHISHLRGIMRRVISQVIKSTDNYELYMREQGDTSYGKQVDDRIYINIGKSIPLNLVTPSAKESYVHELVHAVTRAALSDPKANAIVRKLSAAMRDITEHLNKKYNGKPWKVFLKTDAQGKPIYSVNIKEEIIAAKAAYEYVFNNSQLTESIYVDSDTGVESSTKVRTGLHEFLAYALTNEQLNKALVGMELSQYQEINKQDNIFQKLLAILENVMAWAKEKLAKAQNKKLPVDQAEMVEKLVQELAHVTDKYQFRTQKIVRAMTAANNKVVNGAKTKFLIPFAKKAEFARNEAIKKNQYVRYYAIAFAGYINPVSREEARASVDEMRKMIGASKRGFIQELYREITGNVTMNQRIMERKLMESKQALDSMRDKAIETIANSISIGFETGENGQSLSSQESIAVTRAVIETNFTVLIDDWANVDLLDLAKFFTSSTKRNNAIAGVVKQLSAYGDVGNYYIASAKSLGSHMALGRATVGGTFLNATLIARADALKGTKGIRLPESLETAEALIDRLAALTALQLNTEDTRVAVADAMIREHAKNPKKNGMSNALILIDDFKQESLLRNFEGNKVLMQAGFSKEIFNPDTSIRVDTLDKEAQYKKEGYVLDKDTIPTDPDDSGAPPQMGLYINKSGGHTVRQKFIMSVTNTQMMGHSILQRASENGDKNEYTRALKLVRVITKLNEREARKMAKNPNYVSVKKNILLPVVDELGRIVDYRYTMGKAKKDRILQQKSSVEMVLSSMYGGIVDKEATPRINNDMIEELHKQYLASKNGADFVEVSLDAPTEELRDIYKILPDSTKRFIKEHTGQNKIFIQEEFLDIVFGRKKIRLPGNDTMQQIYSAWAQTVATAKKNIVIKWPMTLAMNVLSNTMFGVIYGVPPEFMFEKQAEGAIKLNNYIADSRLLMDLKLQVKAAIKTGASTKALLAEIVTVETNITTSPIMPLINAGVFQTIVEDIDVLKDPYSYASKVSGFFDDIQGKGGNTETGIRGAREAYRYAYMSDDTAVFKALMATTQFSDFASRYAKYEYMTKFEGIEQSVAMEQIMTDFVNYETPTNVYLQFANDYGLQMFTKYGFRILRVLASLLEGRPLNALGFLALNDVLAAGIASPFDATPFANGSSPLSVIAAATEPSGIKLLEDSYDAAEKLLPGD